MIEQSGNLFVAYHLEKVDNQSLGIMEKIQIEKINIKEIKGYYPKERY
jgi:hypothetical protein